MEQPLILSYLINHASLILSNELSNIYLILVWLLWNSSLFNLSHFIIVWSCGYYYKIWQLLGITPHCWLNAKPLLHPAYTQTLFLFSQPIFLLSYFLVTALLFPSHVVCSVFIGMQTGCLNHKSPAIWLVTCSAWAPLYRWSQVSSELCYTVVTDIGSAELSLLQEYLVWEQINGQGIGY